MLLVLIATQRCKIDVKESKSSDAFHELIDDALRKKMIPEKVYDVIVDSFKSLILPGRCRGKGKGADCPRCECQWLQLGGWRD